MQGAQVLGGGHAARTADLIGEIVESIALIIATGDALAVEIDVLAEGGVGGAAGGVGFVENFAAGTVPESGGGEGIENSATKCDQLGS